MKKKRLLRYICVVILLLLVIFGVVRVAAPSLITQFANRQIESTPGVSGHIEDIDLALYRGAYKVKNLTLFLQENDKSTPTVKIEAIDFSILWSALLQGKIVTEVHVYNGNYQFVDTDKQKDGLTEEATKRETWLPLITLASPISIDKIQIHNNSLTLATKIDNDVHEYIITDLNGEIINLTNSREFSGNKIARFSFQGSFMSEAKINLTGSLDPDTEKPTFDINFEMQKLSVKNIDKLIDFYAPLDIEAGQLDAALEVIAKNGAVNGYVKAGIYNAQVFTWKGDIVEDDDGLLTGIFEGLVDGFASIFESEKNNLLAVNVPVSGTIENTEISTLDALISLFHNAFINAYEIKVDDNFDLDAPIGDNQNVEQ